MIIGHVVCLLGIILAACSPFVGEPTPTCQIVPMPTGEGVWQMEVREAPPRQVQQGEEVRMSVSGGVVVGAQEVHCGDDTELLVPNLATAQVTRRTVRVLLDEKEIAGLQCTFDCDLTFTIPADTTPGGYTLMVVATYGFSLEYSLEVLPIESG